MVRLRDTAGRLQAAEKDLRKLRDQAHQADVKIAAAKAAAGDADARAEEVARMEAELANALPIPVTVRVALGPSAAWEVRGRGTGQVRDGMHEIETKIPANSDRKIRWRVRRAGE